MKRLSLVSLALVALVSSAVGLASRCQAALPCWEELLDEAHEVCKAIRHRVQQVTAGAEDSARSSAGA